MVTYKTRPLRDNAHICKRANIHFNGSENLNVQNLLSAGILSTRGQVINSIGCLKVSNVYNNYHKRKLFLSFSAVCCTE